MARRKKKNSGATAVIVIIVLAVLVVAALVFAWAYKNESGTHKDTGDDTAVQDNVSDTDDDVSDTTDLIQTDTDTDSESIEDTTDDPEPEEHIEISDVTSNDTAELSNGAKATISITAPKVVSTTYAENSELFNELISTEIESFKNEFAQTIAANVPETDTTNDYVFEMTYEVKKSSEGVVSVMLTKYTFTGGAHGGHSYKAINFDLNSGMRIDMQYVTGVPAEEYTPFLKANILEKMKENPDNYYSTEDDVLEDCFDDTQFLITESGIIVFFQEYDIAPFAAGVQMFEIPYNELIELSSY